MTLSIETSPGAWPAGSAPSRRRAPALGARRLGGLARVAVLVAGLVALLAAAAAADGIAVVVTADGYPPLDDAVARLKKETPGLVQIESLAADRDRWPKVRERLAKKEPSVWVAVGPLALEQLSAAGLAQPVVFMVVPAPEETVGAAGVKRLAGVTMQVDATARLREIKALLPGAQRLGIVHDPSRSGAEVAAAQVAARQAGVALEIATVSDVTELGGALRTLLGKSIDALWLLPDNTVTPRGNADAFEFIAGTTLKAGIPVIGYAEKLTEAGALFSLAPDYGEIGAQAAEMVRRIQAGEAPGTVGVQGARAVTLSLNLKVAQTLGIELPAGARERAAQVFK